MGGDTNTPQIDIADRLEETIENIKNKKCILFLGPGAYLNRGKENLEDKMLAQLGVKDKTNEHVKVYYEDGFYLFDNKRLKIKYIKQVRAFYEQEAQRDNPLLEMIAQIPFHLLITFTPDHLLSHTFRKLGFACHEDFYFKNNPPQSPAVPSTNQPLIYNMLGKFSEYESLVLTHNDLFDYLKSIFAEKSMDLKLKETLFKAEQYIFLGLPFEKWYMQLLLRVLKLHTENLEHLERLATSPGDGVSKKIYIDQFSIDFIPSDSTDFVKHLYDEFVKGGHPLRVPKLSAPRTSALSKKALYGLLAAGETEDAMNALKSQLESMNEYGEVYTDLITLMNHFQDIQNQERNSLIKLEDAGIEKNKIIRGLLTIANRVDL
jgi:hypothetical protein